MGQVNDVKPSTGFVSKSSPLEDVIMNPKIENNPFRADSGRPNSVDVQMKIDEVINGLDGMVNQLDQTDASINSNKKDIDSIKQE